MMHDCNRPGKPSFLNCCSPNYSQRHFMKVPIFLVFFQKLECKNENRSSTVRKDKLCLLARLLWEIAAILPSI